MTEKAHIFVRFFVFLACVLSIFLNDFIDAILQSNCENFATTIATKCHGAAIKRLCVKSGEALVLSVTGRIHYHLVKTNNLTME